MARQGKGIFGNPKRNIAQVILSERKGESIIRSKPKKQERTQTPALAQIQKNWEITERIYDELINKGWGNAFKNTQKGPTSKQHFRGELLKLLGSNQETIKRISLFPNSINYDRMKGTADFNANPMPFTITYNLQPRLPIMQNNDKRLNIRYYSDTEEVTINARTGAPNRNISSTNFNWSRFMTNNSQRIWIVLFISNNWDYIYSGMAISRVNLRTLK